MQLDNSGQLVMLCLTDPRMGYVPSWLPGLTAGSHTAKQHPQIPRQIFCTSALTTDTLELPAPELAKDASYRLTSPEKQKYFAKYLPEELKACSSEGLGSNFAVLYSYFTENFKLNCFVITVASTVSYHHTL